VHVPSLEIVWLGQAGFLYTFPNSVVVCTDPYLSHAATREKSRERMIPIPVPAWKVDADIVILTHDHSDHFDELTIRPMAESSQATFVGPSSCLEHWRAMRLAEERFLRLDQGEVLSVAGVSLRALYANHDSGAARDSIGIVLEADSFVVYQVGDSEFDQRLAEQARGLKPDLMCVPINGRLGNMTFDEAARLTGIVEPSTVIPMHYGMFATNTENPQAFVDACREQSISARVEIMKPLRRLELKKG
jgi:L-ascorbate 6-phosphate lactonase